MESSVFTDKSTLPDNENLSQLLREAWKFWEAIKNHINELKNTHKYAEGRGIRIEVKSQEDVENVIKLIDIKVKN